MLEIRLLLSSLVLAAGVAGCALPIAREGAAVEADRGLVGAWIITANRASGVGKNLLAFSSDGTFFRSGDTHPVYSGGHGAWKRVGDREFDATYIAFTFDQFKRLGLGQTLKIDDGMALARKLAAAPCRKGRLRGPF